MKKANGPNKKIITHLMTMPQAAGKNYKSRLIYNPWGRDQNDMVVTGL